MPTAGISTGPTACRATCSISWRRREAGPDLGDRAQRRHGGSRQGSDRYHDGHIAITGTNDAPTLSAGVLAATLEDSSGTAESISGILANQFGDVDHGHPWRESPRTDADTGGTGAWWYSDDGGVCWSQIGSVSDGSALVLRASAYLKFVPAPDYNGTPPALTVYAIDDTYSGSFSSGSGGPAHTDLSQASSHGGSTPFARISTSITTSVTAVNDAPVNTVPDKQCVDEDTPLSSAATTTTRSRSPTSMPMTATKP